MKDIRMSALKTQQTPPEHTTKKTIKLRKYKQILLIMSLCVCTIVPVWAVASTSVATSYSDTYIIEEPIVFSSHAEVEARAIEFTSTQNIDAPREYYYEYENTSYTKVEARAIEFISTQNVDTLEEYYQEYENTSYTKVAARAIEFISTQNVGTLGEYYQEYENTSYTKVEARAIEFISTQNIDISEEYYQEYIWVRYIYLPMLEPWVPYVIMEEPWVPFMVPEPYVPYQPYEIIEVHGPFTRTEARCYFKTWMDWRTITSRNSRQWQLQQIAYTCENGFRRIDGMYMIALGTYYLHHGVGDVFEITLSGGRTFRAVVGDVKSDLHTDPTNRFQRYDGSVVEFIIDRRVMSREVLRMGNVSSAGFHGRIVSMVRLPELFVSGVAPVVVPESIVYTPPVDNDYDIAPVVDIQLPEQDDVYVNAFLYTDDNLASEDTPLLYDDIAPDTEDTPLSYTDLIPSPENAPLHDDDDNVTPQYAPLYNQDA